MNKCEHCTRHGIMSALCVCTFRPLHNSDVTSIQTASSNHPTKRGVPNDMPAYLILGLIREAFLDTDLRKCYISCKFWTRVWHTFTITHENVAVQRHCVPWHHHHRLRFQVIFKLQNKIHCTPLPRSTPQPNPTLPGAIPGRDWLLFVVLYLVPHACLRPLALLHVKWDLCSC